MSTWNGLLYWCGLLSSAVVSSSHTDWERYLIAHTTIINVHLHDPGWRQYHVMNSICLFTRPLIALSLTLLLQFLRENHQWKNNLQGNMKWCMSVTTVLLWTAMHEGLKRYMYPNVWLESSSSLNAIICCDDERVGIPAEVLCVVRLTPYLKCNWM